MFKKHLLHWPLDDIGTVLDLRHNWVRVTSNSRSHVSNLVCTGYTVRSFSDSMQVKGRLRAFCAHCRAITRLTSSKGVLAHVAVDNAVRFEAPHCSQVQSKLRPTDHHLIGRLRAAGSVALRTTMPKHT